MCSKSKVKILVALIIVMFALNVVSVHAYDDRIIWDWHYNEFTSYCDSNWDVISSRGDMYIYCPGHFLAVINCGNDNPTVSYGFVEQLGASFPHYPWLVWSRYGVKDNESVTYLGQYIDYINYTKLDIWAANYLCSDTLVDVIE